MIERRKSGMLGLMGIIARITAFCFILVASTTSNVSAESMSECHSYLAAIFSRHGDEHRKAKAYIETILKQPDKLCEYGKSIGIAIFERHLREWALARNKKCFSSNTANILKEYKHGYLKYKSAVEDDCIASAWTRYLKQIQDDQDFANWSGPPLDHYRAAVK